MFQSTDHQITRSPDAMRAGLLLGLTLTAALFSSAQSQPSAQPQQPPQPQQADDVPAIDGEAGPCSVEWTVTDADAKPVYAATVKVHIAYGFAGTRKLDLEAGTNAQGKVLFKGLPAKVRNPPLEFSASKDQLTGVATYNPATECRGKHSIMVGKQTTLSS
jgi:hypothetical protein